MRFEDSPYYGARVGRAKAEGRWLSPEEFKRLSDQEFQDFRNAQQGTPLYSSANFSNPVSYGPVGRLSIGKIIIIGLALYFLFRMVSSHSHSFISFN